MGLSHLFSEDTLEGTQTRATPMLNMAFSMLSSQELEEAQKKKSYNYGYWNWQGLKFTQIT